jgi:TonB family protein
MRLRHCAVVVSLGLCGCVHPPPRPQAQAPPSARGGSIIATLHKIRDVPPVYPTAALAAKVEGVVVVEAKIDVTGRVTEARILRSIVLLDEAALDAVRQWEFEPVVIDDIGRVPIIAALSVSFKLPSGKRVEDGAAVALHSRRRTDGHQTLRAIQVMEARITPVTT